jgi:hypothetical protein
VIGAISEAHLVGIVDRLKREFEVEANVGRPSGRVPREFDASSRGQREASTASRTPR